MTTQINIVRTAKKVKVFTDIINGVPLEMVFIPSGTFMMGSPETEEDSDDTERPQHEVNITGFFMGRYPITQEQWQAVARLKPVAKELELDPSLFKGNKRPVEQVSWQDAIEFCARLSREKRKNYRLPSQAEWEYACRAGTKTPFHFGETISTEVANYDGNYIYGKGEKGEYRGQTTDVNFFQVTNEFGLSDMHGNVWEWCLDPWHDNYQNAPSDNRVWDDNDNRYQNILSNANELIKDSRTYVLRGGSWVNNPRNCRSAIRTRSGYVISDVGFRVVCPPS